MFLATKCNPNSDALRYKCQDHEEYTQTTEGETAEKRAGTEVELGGLNTICLHPLSAVNVGKFNCASVSTSKKGTIRVHTQHYHKLKTNHSERRIYYWTE